MSTSNNHRNAEEFSFGRFLDQISKAGLIDSTTPDSANLPAEIRQHAGRLVRDLSASRLMSLSSGPMYGDSGSLEFQTLWADSAHVFHQGRIVVGVDASGRTRLTDAPSGISILNFLDAQWHLSHFESVTYQVSVDDKPEVPRAVNGASHGLEHLLFFPAASENPFMELSLSAAGDTDFSAAGDIDEQNTVEIEAKVNFSRDGRELKLTIKNPEDCGLEESTVWAVVEISGTWKPEIGRETRSLVVELHHDDEGHLVPVSPIVIDRPTSPTGHAPVTLRSFTPDDVSLLSGEQNEDALSQVIRFLSQQDIRVRLPRNLKSWQNRNDRQTSLAVQYVAVADTVDSALQLSVANDDSRKSRREAASDDSIPFLKSDDADQIIDFLCKPDASGNAMTEMDATELVEQWMSFQPQAERLIGRRAGGRGQRSDIYQETLGSVLEAARSGNYQLNNPHGYFTTILKRKLISWLRKDTGCQRKSKSNDPNAAGPHEIHSVDFNHCDKASSDAVEEVQAVMTRQNIHHWLDGFVLKLSDVEQQYWYLTRVDRLRGKDLEAAMWLSTEQGRGLRNKVNTKLLTSEQARTLWQDYQRRLRNKVNTKLLTCGAVDRLQGRCVGSWDYALEPLLTEQQETACIRKFVQQYSWPRIDGELNWSVQQRRDAMAIAEPLVRTSMEFIRGLANGSLRPQAFDFCEAWLLKRVDDESLCRQFEMTHSTLEDHKHSTGVVIAKAMEKQKQEQLPDCLVPTAYRHGTAETVR